MRRLQRLTALLLCILMLVPAQGLTVYAENEDQVTVVSPEEPEEPRIYETLPLEAIGSENNETTGRGADETSASLTPEVAEETRIEETLALEELEAEETTRIQETLALEPIEDSRRAEEASIYWNPGGGAAGGAGNRVQRDRIQCHAVQRQERQ